MRVKRFQIGKYGVLLVDFYGCFKTEEIGKTIFFSREEAEAKWAWKDE